MRILLLLLLTMFVISAQSQDADKGLEQLKKDAENGNAMSQAQLGARLSFEGNNQQAVYWLQKGADQSVPLAQVVLAVHYIKGLGVEVDNNQALLLIRKAEEKADLDNFDASFFVQFLLGAFYDNGLAVPQNREKTYYWYHKSAEQGYADAQYSLGNCYYNGCGVSKNYSEAVNWYKKAADQGNINAQYKLGYCFHLGYGVDRNIPEAKKWYEKAAGQGHLDAQFELANLHIFDVGNVDVKAYETFKTLAEKGHVKAQRELGRCFLYGLGVAKDVSYGLKLLIKLSDQGDYGASSDLASYYSDEDVFDYDKASFYYKKASQLSANDLLYYDFLNEMKSKSILSDVDWIIPRKNNLDNLAFGVIIGNEEYKNDSVVPYAEHDAIVFKRYAKSTLGIPEKQIKYLCNATLNDLRIAVNWLKQAMEVCGGKGKAVVYYAGHGISDESDKTAYILPVDGSSKDVKSAYSLQELYSELGSVPSQRVSVFLDACFNGASRNGEMLTSSRGIAVKVKPAIPQGNMVIFNAAQGDETAYLNKEKCHGMFTYYLLKKLKECQGKVSLGELYNYLTSEVRRQSFADNNKVQTPSISVSESLSNSWKSLNITVP